MLPQGSSVIAYKIAAAELAALRAAAHGEAQVTAKKVRILVARIAAAEARFRQSPKIEIQAGHLRSKIGLYITGVKAA